MSEFVLSRFSYLFVLTIVATQKMSELGFDSDADLCQHVQRDNASPVRSVTL